MTKTTSLNRINTRFGPCHSSLNPPHGSGAQDDNSVVMTSNQFPSHHVQRLLAGEPAYTLAVSGKSALHDIRAAFAGQSVKHQSHRFFLGTASRPRHPSDADSQGSLTTFANPAR